MILNITRYARLSGDDRCRGGCFGKAWETTIGHRSGVCSIENLPNLQGQSEGFL